VGSRSSVLNIEIPHHVDRITELGVWNLVGVKHLSKSGARRPLAPIRRVLDHVDVGTEREHALKARNLRMRCLRWLERQWLGAYRETGQANAVSSRALGRSSVLTEFWTTSSIG